MNHTTALNNPAFAAAIWHHTYQGKIERMNAWLREEVYIMKYGTNDINFATGQQTIHRNGKLVYQGRIRP